MIFFFKVFFFAIIAKMYTVQIHMTMTPALFSKQNISALKKKFYFIYVRGF